MSISQMEAVLNFLFYTPHSRGMGLPALIEGLPGPGKTSILQQFAWRHRAAYSMISPGGDGQGAFGVVPVPVLDDVLEQTFLEHPPSRKVKPFIQPKIHRGLMHLDELTARDNIVAPAMLTLLEERRLGDFQLPSYVRVIATYNPARIAANGKALSIPEANRAIHLTWKMPTVSELVEYELENARLGDRWMDGALDRRETERMDADAIEKRVMAEWPEQFGRAIGRVEAFLDKKKALLHSMPDEKSKEAREAWPSHRTWSLFMRTLAGAKIHDLPFGAQMEVLSGCVGEGPLKEFLAFEKNNDLPDPGEWLDGRAPFAHRAERFDRTFAMLSIASSMVASMAKGAARSSRADFLTSFLLGLTKAGAKDLAVKPASVLQKAGALPMTQAGNDLALALRASVEASR